MDLNISNKKDQNIELFQDTIKFLDVKLLTFFLGEVIDITTAHMMKINPVQSAVQSVQSSQHSIAQSAEVAARISARAGAVTAGGSGWPPLGHTCGYGHCGGGRTCMAGRGGRWDCLCQTAVMFGGPTPPVVRPIDR